MTMYCKINSFRIKTVSYGLIGEGGFIMYQMSTSDCWF